ncbi:D-alanyl-D-alanine carboxypeptidase/D-alanyl-D-alanine endopeptidase [Tsukamurella pulmonis]|uniref:D-alanyl-D-alanine carboxypeptidase/D-alanyl-D-alanine endopeptidase n=1 Tax=Tsukamurella pulmonis TaxID=47312 RepID=UPI00079A1859|nr:D-alanyl-D-alanine carboxypeptidase/D-alanyl-D-alanine-endopeptidase [Tsukamurella pulmonis]KXO94657.1 D-alanyl-D-alanine carboxypeptidase [Tsukamurella pulmonis]RDH13389.1 D-alanyl-D-alanine carboxypeptidase/D-alanyl-D-alanine-endopeptidase [Tsukamurella pulmonis]
MRRSRIRRTLLRLTITVVVLALVVVGTVAAALGWGAYRDRQDLAEKVPPRPAEPAYQPAIAEVTPTNPPTAAGVTAQIAGALRSPDLGDFTGVIADAGTGQVLWQRDAARPRTPASTTKVLTAAAALLTLPADKRITTTVVAGASPGEAVLVGAGDPTLRAATASIFTDAPKISDLATQLRRAGTPITRIVVDTSLFTGTDFARGWERADIAGGDITPLQSLMVDAGRIRPGEDYSPRVNDPALAAGQALASALGLPPTAVSSGTAPQGAAQLAAVRSAPLTTRLHDALVHSDNVLAESIGREVAQAAGQPLSFDGSARAVLDTLRTAGFDVGGVELSDVDGLSTLNRIPAKVLDEIVTGAAGTGKPQLRPLLDLLPVGGATGTLADRYVTVNRPGAGFVRAKTGSLSGVSTLAGYVAGRDGAVFTFTLMSSGTPVDVARPAMDAVTAALRGCGCR